LVDFGSVLGGILGPKIDQKSTRKSIEFRSRFWEAFLKTKDAARRQRRGPKNLVQLLRNNKEFRTPGSLQAGAADLKATASAADLFWNRWLEEVILQM